MVKTAPLSTTTFAVTMYLRDIARQISRVVERPRGVSNKAHDLFSATRTASQRTRLKKLTNSVESIRAVGAGPNRISQDKRFKVGHGSSIATISRRASDAVQPIDAHIKNKHVHFAITHSRVVCAGKRGVRRDRRRNDRRGLGFSEAYGQHDAQPYSKARLFG